MQYAATAWDPHKVGNSKVLDSVQRKAAQFVKNDHHYTSTVSRMLQDLGERTWLNEGAISV